MLLAGAAGGLVVSSSLREASLGSTKFRLTTPHGDDRGFITTVQDTAIFTMFDAKGEHDLVSIQALGNGGSLIALRDRSRVTRLELRNDFQLGPSIKIMDAGGRVLWHAP